MPPSTRYTRLATPLVASEAFRYTVTPLTYHGLWPGIPDRLAFVEGRVVSTKIVRVTRDSTFPARSVAWKSTA